MELIVAEKPKVAEKIASAIGGSVKVHRLGQVSYFQVEHDGEETYVAPAVGHVYTLAEKKKTTEYPVFDIQWYPSYVVDKGADYTKQYVNVLEKLGKKADVFVSACDYDIEGSTIAYNIFRFATKIKEGRRMKFSALTSGDILDAYKNMGDFDYNNAHAGEARHILDWYYGINLSRALMRSIRAVNRYKVLSIGRVQGPALEILAELESRIQSFKPTPYWELTADIKGTEFMHAKGRFTDESKAKKALENTASDGKVVIADKKQQKIKPNPNFDLTALQVEVHRVFRITPSRTLQITQNLYEASLISYPRTSSNQIPPSINLQAILDKFSSHSDYGKIASALLAKKRTKVVQGKKADPAHPAIHPTGQNGKIAGDDLKVYDLIVRRFLASFAEDAVKERSKIVVDAGGELYGANGVITQIPGWTEIYGKYYSSDDKELPSFEKDESVKLGKKDKIAKMTKPPNRFTQASIVSELEKRHLGTKATRSVIIETLYKRGYVEDKSIDVTDFGMKVRDILKKYAPEILDEDLTRKIELDMESIQEGKTDKDTVIKNGQELLVQLLDRWKKNERKIGEDLIDALKVTQEKESILGVCEKCGGNLRIIRMGAGKQFVGCTGYPNCRNTYPLPGGALIKSVGSVCQTCSRPEIFVIRKGRKSFKMCINPACSTKANWGKPKTTETKPGEKNEKNS